MRTLKFIIRGQTIEPDPSCDFSGLVPGTKGYLRAEFIFPADWNHCSKVASFYSMLGKEYASLDLLHGRFCAIPDEALERRAFKIRVIGKNDNLQLKTNKLTVCQNG